MDPAPIARADEAPAATADAVPGIGRVASAQAVVDREARFSALFDAAGVGMSLVDMGGRTVDVNPALARFLGYPRDEVRALSFGEVTHPDDVAADSALFAELVAGRRESYRIDKRYRRRDGATVWGSLTASLVRGADGGPRYVVRIVEDISQRVRLDAHRRLLAEASRLLSASLDRERTLQTVARLAVPELADWCAVDLLDPGGELRRVAAAGPDAAREELAKRLHAEHPPRRDAPGGVWAVIASGEPQLVPEISDEMLAAAAHDEAHLDLMRRLGLRSAVVVPLLGREGTLGALTLVDAESGRRFGEADVALAMELAGRAAVAIENARLYARAEEARQAAEEQALELEAQSAELQETQAELEISNDELQRANDSLAETARAEEEARQVAEAAERRARFLAEASRLLGASLDYETTLRNVARAAVPELADWCAVDMLADPDAAGWPPDVRRLAVEHQDPARVAWARELERRVPQDWNAPTGLPQVLRAGTAEFYPRITDVMLAAAAKSPEELALLREVGFSAFICVPLLARGQVLGAITLCTTDSGRPYGQTDLEMAWELARRAAVAVDNARLYAAEHRARETAERAADRVARLQKVTAAFSEAASPERVAQVVVAEGCAALGAAAGAVSLLSEDGETLELVRQAGLSDAVGERFRRFPVNAPLPMSIAVRERRPVYITSEAERREEFPDIAREYPVIRTAAWASLPLEVEGRVLGAVAFGFPEARGFAGADEAFLRALAQQCAQAFERARLLEAEQRARAEAEGASRAKSDFLAVMSHELRTPMNAVLGYLDLLEAGVAGELTPVQQGYVARVTSSGRHLLGVIEQVLTFSRIEAGREEAAPEPAVLGGLVHQAVEIVEPLARARGLAFRAVVEGEDAVLSTDPGKVRQILVNLLGNAVKFTDAGEVELRVTLSSPEEVLFAVRDTGIGIPAESQERIFEPFWQVAQGPTRGAGGTGLGLAVARDLSRMLGGELSVSSVPGEGSTFTVRLPRAAPPRSG